jgi:hypothetical protein
MSYIGPPPNLTTVARDALTSADRPTGTIIFNTTNVQLEVNIGTAGSPVWTGLGKKSLVTTGGFGSLTPVDGDEAILQVDTATGVNWRFRYNAGSASTYKWEFQGGPPLEVRTNFGVGSTAWANNPGTALAVPRNGEYLCEVNAEGLFYQSMQLYFTVAQSTPGGDPADMNGFQGGFAQTTGITVSTVIRYNAVHRLTKALTAGTASVYSRSVQDSQFSNWPSVLATFTITPRRVA